MQNPKLPSAKIQVRRPNNKPEPEQMTSYARRLSAMNVNRLRNEHRSVNQTLRTLTAKNRRFGYPWNVAVAKAKAVKSEIESREKQPDSVMEAMLG